MDTIVFIDVRCVGVALVAARAGDNDQVPWHSPLPAMFD
jgi:hypothetical protein